MNELTLVDFEAGMNTEEAKEALRRWNAHQELVKALSLAMLAIDKKPFGILEDERRAIANILAKAQEVKP